MTGTINFLVGQIFLPLRNMLAHGDPSKAGRVFYVFAAVLTTSMILFSRVYRS
jgi:MFS transporter, SP family, solute carrier family 2 (facilitated glucose transporter), member 3